MGKPAITGKSSEESAERLRAEAERLRAEAERARRRAAIQAEIDKWNEKLNKVKLQKANLGLQQIILNTYMRKWDTQKTTYSGNDILTEVVILNVFEGVCADTMKEKLTDSVTQMDRTYSGVSGLNGNVGLQISRLDEYITFINEKITALRSELNSI
ncbi:MAG: hypothetical protein K2N85_11590 [Lachnospiraceae bacterium]|nr:hypothetical protein [Lachnospiraceae bacterium]